MTRLANNVEAEFAATEIKTSLIGRKCWYGYVTFGNTFQIVLGRKIARDPAEVAARDRLHKRMVARRIAKGVRVKPADPLSREFDRFQGESSLLVWCSWRLDGEKGPVTSWDDEGTHCQAGISRLIGRTVRNVSISGLWNLQVEFNGGLVLSVFPDHVSPSASFDGNWEVWQPTQAYLIGTGLMCEVIDRENRPLHLQPRQGRWQAKRTKSAK